MISGLRRALALLWLSVAGIAAPSAADPAARPRTLDDCDALVREMPSAFDSYYCYWGVARRDRSYDDAARRLEARLSVVPEDEKARLYLGLIAADRGDPGALGLLERAAEGFRRQRDPTGEIYARQSIVRIHERAGRREDAERQLSQLVSAAERSGDPALIVRATVQQGWHAQALNDHGRAYLTFRRARERLAPGMPPDLPRMVLDGLAASAFTLDRFEESANAYREEIALLSERGDRFTEADARLWLWMAEAMLDASEAELAAMAREALDVARASGNRGAEAYALLFVGRTSVGAAAREHFEAAAALARETNSARAEIGALEEWGASLALDLPSDPEEGLARLDEAHRLAQRSGNADLAVETRAARAVVLLRLGRDGEARPALAEALDELERLRARQPEPATRSRVAARFAPPFREAAGLLLARAARGGSPEDLATAYAVLERLRGQQLRDRLAVDGPAPESAEREAVLREIAGLQRRLIEAPLAAREREVLLASLEALETAELEIRDRIAREAAGARPMPAPYPPQLETIQRSLGQDQALLYFVVDDRERRRGAGSWAIAIHRGGVSAHPLPERSDLQRRVAMLRAFVERRDGSDAEGAVALHRDLLEAPLAALPRETRRLVIVPDGPLFALPFDLLRPASGAPPVAARLGIVIAPSAAVWRASAARPALENGDVLALGDPDLPVPGRREALSREWTLLGAAELGRLPYVQEELEGMRRALGTRVVVRQGEEATEHSIKSGDLERLVVLHLAAHAIVEERQPERSAIVLGPGTADEDGLLQAREIPALPLAGRAVVLSACRSATGELLASEGPVGLSHAFFLAGARAVVGSLWPVRDAEAAPLIREFYDRLAAGATIEEALAGARRDRLAAGAPAAAWAGFVLLGDGAWAPFPGGVPSPGGPAGRWLLLVAVVVVAAAAAAGLNRRSAGRSGRAAARHA